MARPTEMWLSILVRPLLRQGSVTSVEDLEARVLAFTEYDTQATAYPFAWACHGKAFVA